MKREILIVVIVLPLLEATIWEIDKCVDQAYLLDKIGSKGDKELKTQLQILQILQPIQHSQLQAVKRLQKTGNNNKWLPHTVLKMKKLKGAEEANEDWRDKVQDNQHDQVILLGLQWCQERID